MSKNESKIFISHSTADKESVNHLVELLEFIGYAKEDIFCSSIPGYGIPNDRVIAEYLLELFESNELYVLFILSQNYYQSPVCMNEMGAAWVLKSNYTSVLLPGFQFRDINGLIDPRKISLKMDDTNVDVLKNGLDNLKDTITSFVPISYEKPRARWENKRDQFIEKMNEMPTANIITSDDCNPGANCPVKALADSYVNKGEEAFQIGDIKLALKYYENAAEEYEKLACEKELLDTYLRICISQKSLGNSDKVAEFLLKISRCSNGNSDLAIHKMRASLESRHGLYKEARKNYAIAEKICIEKGASKGLVDILRLSAIMEGKPELNNYNVALELFERAKAKCDIKDTNQLAMIYQSIGDMQREHGKHEYGLHNYIEAQKLFTNHRGKYIIMGELCRAYAFCSNKEESNYWKGVIEHNFKYMPENIQKYNKKCIDDASACFDD